MTDFSLFYLICFIVKQSEVQNIEIAVPVTKVCLKLSFNSDGLTSGVTRGREDRPG